MSKNRKKITLDRNNWHGNINCAFTEIGKSKIQHTELKRTFSKSDSSLILLGDRENWESEFCHLYLLSKAGYVNNMKFYNKLKIIKKKKKKTHKKLINFR